MLRAVAVSVAVGLRLLCMRAGALCAPCVLCMQVVRVHVTARCASIGSLCDCYCLVLLLLTLFLGMYLCISFSEFAYLTN